MNTKSSQEQFISLSDCLPTFEKETLYTPAETIEELQESSVNGNGYKCYACHDTGWVVNWVVEKIIPNYSDRTDKYCICDRLDTCREKIPNVMYELSLYDPRFNKALLDKIHELNKLNWKKTTLEKANNMQKKINAFIDNY